MKSLIAFIIIIITISKSQGQVITDTSRCGDIKQGHLRLLIDEFKNSCLEKGTRYSYDNVAFTNKETVSYLNQALNTKIFNKYCFLEKNSSEIIASGNGHRISWGMVEIGFKSRKDEERAIAIIKSQHRSYFRLEVATAFVLLRERNTIIIVFAEVTSLNNDILNCFFNKLKIKGQYIPIK